MKSLSVIFGGYSSPGVKDENQDALAAMQPSGAALQYKGAVASIADGLSSSERAREASATCATMFIQDYLQTPETWSVERSAEKIIRSLNSWCFAQGNPELSHLVHTTETPSYMTTLSSVVFKSRTAYTFHVGDSRIYRWQNGDLEQLTRDHKQVQGKQEFLTRAVGADAHIDVDFSRYDLCEGDLFLLSTDGMHQFIPHKQLCEIVAQRHISLEAKAQALVNRALENGSDDNISCLFAQVKSLPSMDIDESYAALGKLAIPPGLSVGNVLEGYKVLEVLFEGTRSAVYKVLCLDTREVYALKTPSMSFRDDLVYLRGFVQEQWIGQKIQHDNVMKILPRKPDSQFLYHVCELIEGQTLRQWMLENPNPSLAQVRDIIKPVVSALRKMQRLDMVHRDLKPENIMLTHEGIVKLVDFGTIQVASLDQIASPIEEEVAMGSINYVAPETLLRNESSHRSDLFSLGVICYEMLTGRLPFKRFPYQDYRPKSWSEWRYHPIHQYRSELPAWVDAALRKACEAQPEQRYQAYSEFLQDLEQPSEAHLNALKHAPLMERNPMLFWQLLCAVLAGLNIAQFFW
ncbi:MAG: protein kinase [Oleiphilaceae bacterium]|nr:protein kinase [Oleiphilaceae bacterium]